MAHSCSWRADCKSSVIAFFLLQALTQFLKSSKVFFQHLTNRHSESLMLVSLHSRAKHWKGIQIPGLLSAVQLPHPVLQFLLLAFGRGVVDCALLACWSPPSACSSTLPVGVCGFTSLLLWLEGRNFAHMYMLHLHHCLFFSLPLMLYFFLVSICKREST